MTELNFIEYNANPTSHSVEDCEISIRGLGFKRLSVSRCNKASMWVLGKCILLFSTREDTETGLSGIGFNSDNCLDGSIKCSITGLNFCKFHGINIYSYPIELFRKNYDEHFDSSYSEDASSLPINYVAGLTIDNNSLNTMTEFVEKLRFKILKKSEYYVTSVCSNNRLSILWNNSGDKLKFKKLILTSDDICSVVADYATMGFDLTTASSEDSVNNFFKKVDIVSAVDPSKQKIKAYGLNVYGKPKSYVIEKLIKEPLPNLDIVISQRFNHNGVNEESMINYEYKDTKNFVS